MLRSGRGIATYRATDRAVEAGGSHTTVVLKVADLDAVPEGTELLLRHEAAVLGLIESPQVAPLLDVGVDERHLYLAMPHVEGVTLRDRLAAGPLDVTDTLTLAHGVVTALASVFEHGILHRDVKPSNILVNENGPLEQVTLIDFGFSRSDQLVRSLRDIPLGSIRYASPEQLGLLSHDVDERSDLYSVGVVLFEALAGHPPFEDNTVAEVLRQHLTAAVPSLRDLGIAIPRALDEIVSRLLAKEPANRYQTAHALLTDLVELRDALARGIEEPTIVIANHDRRCCVLGEPTFVGRRGELGSLQQLLEPSGPAGSTHDTGQPDRTDHRPAAGAPGRADSSDALLVHLEAQSGGGKTRLLDEFAHRARMQGAMVLRGQGVNQTAQRPFQTLQGVVEGIINAASDDPGIRSRVVTGLAEHAAAVVAVFPALGDILPDGHDRIDPPDVLGPEIHGTTRSLAALTALLDSVAAAEQTTVILLDDCQWADHLTVGLLDQWRHQSGPRRGRVIVVASYRSEEISATHPLRDGAPDHHVVLDPLDPEEICDLAESMAGELPDEVTDAVAALADGSPFMASAVLHGLVESGALACEHPGWTVDIDTLADARSSTRAGIFLARRLELLPSTALGLLTAGAVLGKEFDLELAAHLSEQDPVTAVRSRDAARERHLVWNIGSGARVAFVHDKIREALLERIEPDAARSLHLAAAERIETGSRHRDAAALDERAFELAHHYDAAGRHGNALPYALAAAAHARARHALDAAEIQYRIAERGARTSDIATRCHIAAGLGHVTMLLGRYDEARKHFERALGLAEGQVTRSEIEASLGELAFKRGDLEEAAAANERGLRLVGRRIPKSTVAFITWAMWEIAVQVAHSLFGRIGFAVGRRATDHRRAACDLLAARHYSRLAHVYWFTRGPVPTLWAHLREVNVAERYEPTRELAQAYSEHGPAMTLLPWFGRGIRYMERSLAIRRELGDLWGQGQSLGFYGVVLYAAGRYDETIAKCQEAIRLLERTGDRWELNIARIHLAFAHYRKGQLGKAVSLARQLHDDGVAIGDPQASGIAVEIGAKASGGRIPEEVVAAERSRDSLDTQLRVEVLQAEAIRLLHHGDVDTAVDTLEDAIGLARRARLRNEYVASARAWLATACRSQLEALPAYAPERRRLARRARRAAHSARRIARPYANNCAHARRESGIIAALTGRPRRAQRHLRRATQAAQRHGALHEYALSLDAFGRYGTIFGWVDADQAALEAGMLLHEIEADVARTSGDLPLRPAGTTTLSLVERFDTLLDQGRRLASGLSREAVFRSVERAALELLRAEHCVVLDVGDRDPIGIGADAAAESLSSSLLHRAMETGRPVTSHEVFGDPPDTMTLSSVRSALCAPISERGVITSCFYATHTGIAELFGEEEVRLAEFVATLAGAALENARGFAEIETFQRSLEHRVEERTAQLTTTLHELERVNEQLRAASEAKSDFVSMVSHELRSPLTPIVGLSSTLLQQWESLDDSLREECLNSIHRQGARLARLVDDLLEMSRIEAGAVDADPRIVAVSDVIAMSLEHFSENLTDVDVAGPTNVQAMADPDRLQQILLNYLENARKYGAPPYRIEVEVVEHSVEVRVIDEGDGVPPEFVDELFEKFTRADGSKRGESGTGLGLSIVRGLAEAQGGEAWYEPHEPHGARFCVRLPLAATGPQRPGRLPAEIQRDPVG